MAVLLAAYVENTLQRAIIRNYHIDKSLESDLFDPMRPLADFSAKIRIAQALRIIGPQTRLNLDVVRTIRNAFAHAMIPVSFGTPQIARACELLTLPPMLMGAQIPTLDCRKFEGRKRYKRVCEVTVSNLMVHTFGGPVGYEPSEMGLPVEHNYEVWARQEPLH
jgi:hypothetical protein